MRFNQLLLNLALLSAVLQSLPVCAQELGEADGAAAPDVPVDTKFIDAINKIYRLNKDDRFSQFNQPWHLSAQGPSFRENGNLERAELDLRIGKKTAACADYLASIRDVVNLRKKVDLAPRIAAITDLYPSLNNEEQRLLAKAIIVVCGEARRAFFAEGRGSGMDTLLGIALSIKDKNRDTDEDLVSALMSVGAIRASEKNYEGATESYKRALSLIREIKPDDDSLLLSCVNALSAIYVTQQNQKQNEYMLKGVLSTLDARSKNDGGVAKIPFLIRLFSLYKQEGKISLAQETGEQMVAIFDGLINKPVSKIDTKASLSACQELMNHSSFYYGFRNSHVGSEEKILKAAFLLKLKINGFGTWVSYDLSSISRLLSVAGKEQEAIALYRSSIEASKDYGDGQITELLQQHLLSFLRSPSHEGERKKLEAELKGLKEERNIDSYRRAIQALSEAKNKQTTEPGAYVRALLSVASASLELNKNEEAFSNFEEAVSIAKKLKPEEYQDSGFSSMWSIARNLLTHSQSKNDERAVFDLADFEEQRLSLHPANRYSAMDLNQIVRIFMDKHKPAEAEEFVKHLIVLRKQYRPHDYSGLAELYGQLKGIYGQSSEPTVISKLIDASQELVKLDDLRYGADNIHSLYEKCSLALLFVKQGKTELADKTLAPLLNKVHVLESKGKDRSKEEEDELNQIARKLNQVSQTYLLIGNLNQAEKYSRQALQCALREDPSAGANSDRIVRIMMNSGQFLKATELLKLRVEVKERTFGNNCFESAQQRIQLSEAYFKYGTQLGMQGKKALADEWKTKSETEFKQALELIEKAQGVDSVAAKDARKRREILTNPVVPSINSSDDVT